MAKKEIMKKRVLLYLGIQLEMKHQLVQRYRPATAYAGPLAATLMIFDDDHTGGIANTKASGDVGKSCMVFRRCLILEGLCL
jgi:hypothetical protein